MVCFYVTGHRLCNNNVFKFQMTYVTKILEIMINSLFPLLGTQKLLNSLTTGQCVRFYLRIPKQ